MFKQYKFTIIIVLIFLLMIKFQMQLSAQSDSFSSQNTYNNKIPISLMSKVLRTQIDPLSTKIDYTNLAIISGITLATGITIHIYQANAWWQEQGSKFKVVNDWKYALWIDKMGHFFGTTLTSHALSAALEGANLDLERAAVYGALGALAFELFIEIEDGFGPQWGFSPGDASSDILGAAFSIGQYYYPFLKNIQPRVSYYPSEEFRAGQHKGNNIIDDYSGQKYWLAFRISKLLPDEISAYWPSFLMISTGMGIKNWNGFGGGSREFFIALDFDAEAIPLYGKFWQFVKNTLNYIHFPLPGIRISPKFTAFAIVF